MNNEYIIDVNDICKSYDGKVVLDHVSLRIRKGEFVTILGPSGCGKTTLLRLIGGFEKPSSGTISLNGEDMTFLQPYQRPLNTVFQRYALFPHLDVYENVAFGLQLRHIKQREIDDRVMEALRLVGMTEYADRDISRLSGGQQQRVAIARAVVNKPEVLLLDEPLSALDLKLRKEMQLELMRMHKELGITFIFVTHDQEEALTMSDTVVVMNGGTIQQMGTPKHIYDEPCNTFVADFIGESNIMEGIMVRDQLVNFLGKNIECVDHGFEQNSPVYVIIRPEDISLHSTDSDGIAGKQVFSGGTVRSCVFKGVHYELFLETPSGFMLQVHNYTPQQVGDELLASITPDNIHVIQRDTDSVR